MSASSSMASRRTQARKIVLQLSSRLSEQANDGINNASTLRRPLAGLARGYSTTGTATQVHYRRRHSRTCTACPSSLAPASRRSLSAMATTSSDSHQPDWNTAAHAAVPSTSGGSRVRDAHPTTAEDRVRELLEKLHFLLAGATGRTPGKTRQVAFTASDGGYDEEQAWLERLTSALLELPEAGSRRTRLTVLADSHKSAAQLVLALLDDPLSSDDVLFEQFKRHIRSANGITRIAYGEALSYVESTLRAPLAFLKDNAVDIQTVIHPDPKSPMTPDAWTALLSGDMVLVLAPPDEQADSAKLARKANVIHLRPRADPFATPAVSRATSLRPLGPVDGPAAQDSSSGDRRRPELPSLPLDAALALQANESLRSATPYSGGSALKTTDFSSAILSSGIPQLREVITATIDGTTPSTSSHRAIEGHVQRPGSSASSSFTSLGTQNLHLQTATHLASALVLALTSAVAEARTILYAAGAQVGQLELRSARDKRHSQIELGFTDMDRMDLEELVRDTPSPATSGRSHQLPDPSKGQTDSRHVKEMTLLEDGKRGAEIVLESANSRLKWWKLPAGRADDIVPELGSALSGYFAGLEHKLIFETGRLSERALALSSLVDDLFKAPSSFSRRAPHQPSLYSATLQNELVALSPTTQFGFPPPAHPSPLNLRQSSLSLPIIERRAQLLSPGGPIEGLQLRAQKAVAQFYALGGGSAAVATFLTQTTVHELSVDFTTGVGIGMFGFVAALWHLQGKWKKAKAAFWKDWERAQEALAYDLQANADRILEKNVFVKADTARHLLRKQLEERNTSLAELENSLRRSIVEIGKMGVKQ